MQQQTSTPLSRSINTQTHPSRPAVNRATDTSPPRSWSEILWVLTFLLPPGSVATPALPSLRDGDDDDANDESFDCSAQRLVVLPLSLLLTPPPPPPPAAIDAGRSTHGEEIVAQGGPKGACFGWD